MNIHDSWRHNLQFSRQCIVWRSRHKSRAAVTDDADELSELWDQVDPRLPSAIIEGLNTLMLKFKKHVTK